MGIQVEKHQKHGAGAASLKSATVAKRPDTARRAMTATVRLPGLTVFLPSHNEEGNVERVVRDFLDELPRVAERFEVVVVDDGSRDRTGEIADRLAAENPHVLVVHHSKNLGYGGAVNTGLRSGSQPYLLLSDGDGQFDPAEMWKLTSRITDCDVVIGLRARRADNLMRRINGKAWTTLSRVLFGLRISDMDCGFKLFRREAIEGITLHSNSAMITAELMARLAGRNARISQVDVTHLPRVAGEQTGNSPMAIVQAFKEMLLLYRDLKAARRGSNSES
jgi:glycosyltransferase involved in cell wall biosynthesis